MMSISWILFGFLALIPVLLYKKTRSLFLAGLCFLLILAISLFDVIYGNIVYYKYSDSWPEYTVNSIAKPYTPYTFAITTDNSFDSNKFVAKMRDIYKNNEDVSYIKTIETFNVHLILNAPKDSKKLHNYIFIRHEKNYGTCVMCSEEVYDLSTGKLAGRSRVIRTKNVLYSPFFYSTLRGMYWGYSKEASKTYDRISGKNRSLMNDIFPKYFP